MSNLIDRQAAIDALERAKQNIHHNIERAIGDAVCGILDGVENGIEQLPTIHPEIIRCKDCKHNPKYEWFGCPMSHLSEKQRPETAWCWKAERRTDERSD